MALKPTDTASLDESLGAALIRAFDREDVRDKFANIFTDKCQIMIDESTKLTNIKIDEVIETAQEQNNRIVHLERMADDAEQDRRGTNLIIKGIKPTDTPKLSIANIITTKIGIATEEDEIKFAVKINNHRAEEEHTDSYKFCFFERKKRDIVYANRMKLRHTKTYLSEDLTMNRSKLSFETRTYAKSLKAASTWTTDGKIYLKDAEDARPRVIYTSADLKPQDPKLRQI